MNWKSNKVIVPVVAAVALGVGLVAGSGGPETVTKTETKTVTETVDSTPQACVDAMDAAEALVTGPVVEQTEDSVVLVGLIPLAFEAGVNMDNAAAQDIIDTLDETTARSESRNVEIESLVTEYNEASEKCRASAGTKS